MKVTLRQYGHLRKCVAHSGQGTYKQTGLAIPRVPELTAPTYVSQWTPFTRHSGALATGLPKLLSTFHLERKESYECMCRMCTGVLLPFWDFLSCNCSTPAGPMMLLIRTEWQWSPGKYPHISKCEGTAYAETTIKNNGLLVLSSVLYCAMPCSAILYCVVPCPAGLYCSMY